MLIYRDGALALQVRLDGHTAWLTQRGLAELFQVSVKTISEHLGNIFDEDELDPAATIRKFRIVQIEGTREVSRQVEHYSLEAILAVGYRVRSRRGTEFRQWATDRLAELLVKGFTLDDERIAAGRTIGQDYFDELLERIRDIRASERLEDDAKASGLRSKRESHSTAGGFHQSVFGMRPTARLESAKRGSHQRPTRDVAIDDLDCA